MNKRYFIVIGLILLSLFAAYFYFANNKNKFNSGKITIYYDASVMDDKFFEITDKNIINDIVSICLNGKFRKVTGDERLEGLCSIFINFNNGTVIGMYNDIDYGNIQINNDYLDPIGNPIHLPEGLNAYINKLIKNKL